MKEGANKGMAVKEVFKIQPMSIKDYIAKYHTAGLSTQAVSYAMDNDLIDFVRVGHERLVILTDKTKAYVPNQLDNIAPTKNVKVSKTTMQL